MNISAEALIWKDDRKNKNKADGLEPVGFFS